jgi:hypothetical protein
VLEVGACDPSRNLCLCMGSFFFFLVFGLFKKLLHVLSLDCVETRV